MKKLNVFLPLLLALASCQNNSPKHLQQVRLNLAYEPLTMDPRKGGDVISSHMHFMLFEGLTQLEANGNISCALAESIDISSDKTVYT
ncbi:MAG: peptide ABC transporter substrate-binding protein, partial [Chlamydiales bacterium]|nr:peptide ABC transporter substrate-binding protein [Chlamydiales bacterium]